jgi:formylglycine-generating enzyme required for sulfatase activity
MGSPTTEDGHNSSETQHSVTITRAYCMKATEVTQGEWQEEMGDNPSSFLSCGSNCPLEQVSWDDAIGYANALSGRAGLQECYTGSTFTGLDCTGYRLPTEAEWEYAARGGTTGPTYGLMDSVGWYTDNSGSRTHPVGGKTANNFGLYDMLGNVWEWTGDWYGTYPGTVTDPTGPTTGSSRVYRGGSWAGPARYARAATRYVAPVSRRSYLGFRLVRTAQ